MVERPLAEGFWPSRAEPFRSFGSRLADWFAPAADASDDDKSYRISVELPGVVEKAIDVQVDDGRLTIRGEKKSSREEKGDSRFFSERQTGSFSRSFRLPADADEAAVKAAIKDGVLTVTVPKKGPSETAKAKSVPIARGG